MEPIVEDSSIYHHAPERRTAHPAKTLSPLRRRSFIILTFLTPFVLFLFLEALLRLVHYGPSLDLFVQEERAGKTFFIMNPDVRRRYFQSVDFTPTTSKDYFQMPKPAGVFRIFVLGGSTAVGFPYGHAGSFPSFLKDRLEHIFPAKAIEVINLAMTATNSITVTDIARELPEYDPDLIIVYDGHNEFYGALGVASHESGFAARWAVDLHLRLVHWKSYFLFRSVLFDIFSILGHGATSESGTMMEQLAKGQLVRLGSDRYEIALNTFEQNLAELAEICRSSSVPLVLGTQVSNLRDQPPLTAETREGAVDDRDRLLEALVQDASLLESRGALREALQKWESAILRNPTHAGYQYHAARLYDTLGMSRDALLAYRHARDFDLLRFRADSRFNDAIKRMENGVTLGVADCEAALMASSPDSLIGENYILEHLHPNLEGNFLLAKSYAEAMRGLGLLGTREEWRFADTLDEAHLRAKRIVTDLDLYAARHRIGILLAEWPFNRPVRPPDPPRFLAAFVDSLLSGTNSWEEVHVMAAQAFEREGMLDKAELEYRCLLDQLPHSVSPVLALGQILIRQNRIDEAAAAFRQSLERERTGFALIRLGSLELDRGNTGKALSILEEAYSISVSMDERVESSFLLALACHLTGENIRARHLLQNALAINPSYQPALQLLRRLSSS